MKGCILLVDDNEEFLDSTRDVLEDEGYEIHTASDGETALRMIDAHTFDVILMDIKMPGMNGVESFIEMKKLQPDVKVIMVTAYSIDELIHRALEEGAVAVLNKPIDMDKTIEIIDEVRRAGRGGLVMIADDNRELCDSLAVVLQSEGFHVLVAYDGEQAVEAAERQTIDVLLLDMKLPILNGLEVFRRIRAMQPGVITILISGYAEEMHDMIQQTLSESAHTCLRKPLDMERLLDLLEGVCTAKRSGDYYKPGDWRLQ